MKDLDATEKAKKNKTLKVTTGAWWKTAPEIKQEREQSTEKEERRLNETAAGKEAKKESPQSHQKRARKNTRSRVLAKEKNEQSKKNTVKEKQEHGAAARKRSQQKSTKKNAPNEAHIGDVSVNNSSIAEKKVHESTTGQIETSIQIAASSKNRKVNTPPGKKRSNRKNKGKEEVEKNSQDNPKEKNIETSKNKEQSLELPQPKEVKKQDATEPTKKLKLLINAEEPEECRLALLEDGRLQSIHVSTASKRQRKNNIYKAKVVAIEPSLQAAFVDYGTEKNGFLPLSEIHPEYFKQELAPEINERIQMQQWKKLSISDVLERGTELLVQVVKEEVGKKGANMTTFLSLPGRCAVLMPGSDSTGISRKVSGDERRKKLRNIMNSIDIPEGIGWIVRTAGSDMAEDALARDINYLLELWKTIRSKGQELSGMGLLYEDQRSVARFLREYFDPAIEEILVDSQVAIEQVKEFIAMQPTAHRGVRVRLHQGARPIFNQYSVEDQIESIYQPQVNLPSGGSIVINPTEALVAIDVNSGSTSKGENFEESIFQANIEAADELARQLRLRDLGGLIVVDFIDMRNRKHIIAVEKQVKQAMKRDKAKVDFSRISKFGLMQISRQKLGAPIETGNYRICEYCKGRGTIRSIETLSLFYLRRIQTGSSRKQVQKVEGHFPMEVASYLLNHKRAELSEMEKRYDVEIIINAHSRMKPTDNEVIFHKQELMEKNIKKNEK